MNRRLLLLDIERRRIKRRVAEHQRDEVSQVAVQHVARTRRRGHERIPASLATPRQSVVPNDASHVCALFDTPCSRASTCEGVRQLLAATPLLHCRDFGSQSQRRGSVTTPSFRPSFASQADRTASCTSFICSIGNGRARRLEDLVSYHAARLHQQAVDRRAGDDAVIVIRIALGFHHAHASASGASLVVVLRRGATVITGDDLFAQHRHLVNGAVAEIGDRHGVIAGPRGISGRRGSNDRHRSAPWHSRASDPDWPP